MSRTKVLLGTTKDKEIVFGEFEITQRNGYPEFTASFETVRPFKENEIDLEDYFESYADERQMGAEYVLQLCREHNCSPQNLPYELAQECDDVRDALDCSLFPEMYEVQDEYGYKENWYFESGSYGQHDTREEMETYVDKRAYDMLHELWDKYHLCDIGNNPRAIEDRVEDKLKEIELRLNVDWEDWITEYIRKELM